MLLVLPLQFAQMRVEAIETLLLKDPVPLHPLRRIAEPSRLEACGPPLRVAPARDEAGVLVTTRVFDAPPERVYKAWTDPKQLAQWFPPEGLTAPVCQLDVRVGGAMRIDMKGPEGEPFKGRLFPGKGVYREVVPNRRLAFTFTPEMEGQAMPTVLMTVEFEDQAGKTKLTIQQRLG